ncbi:hypothetical protein B484DRAFT_408576 [Ochromonadaceae sp. CCMP2298]|nr:hypothetical protein B484DRAFT_408576 [Ochromonadaceae sp. CCMP2298]
MPTPEPTPEPSMPSPEPRRLTTEAVPELEAAPRPRNELSPSPPRVSIPPSPIRASVLCSAVKASVAKAGATGTETETAVPLGLRLSVGGDTMEEIMVGTEGVETEGGAKSDRSDGLGAFRANARVGVGAWVRLGAVTPTGTSGPGIHMALAPQHQSQSRLGRREGNPNTAALTAWGACCAPAPRPAHFTLCAPYTPYTHRRPCTPHTSATASGEIPPHAPPTPSTPYTDACTGTGTATATGAGAGTGDGGMRVSTAAGTVPETYIRAGGIVTGTVSGTTETGTTEIGGGAEP